MMSTHNVGAGLTCLLQLRGSDIRIRIYPAPATAALRHHDRNCTTQLQLRIKIPTQTLTHNTRHPAPPWSKYRVVGNTGPHFFSSCSLVACSLPFSMSQPKYEGCQS